VKNTPNILFALLLSIIASQAFAQIDPLAPTYDAVLTEGRQMMGIPQGGSHVRSLELRLPYLSDFPAVLLAFHNNTPGGPGFQVYSLVTNVLGPNQLQVAFDADRTTEPFGLGVNDTITCHYMIFQRVSRFPCGVGVHPACVPPTGEPEYTMHIAGQIYYAGTVPMTTSADQTERDVTIMLPHLDPHPKVIATPWSPNSNGPTFSVTSIKTKNIGGQTQVKIKAHVNGAPNNFAAKCGYLVIGTP